jgi:mono/diheme cytochrome c family protein
MPMKLTNSRPLVIALPLAALLGGGPLSATADEVDAQALIDKNCTSCHGSEMYTRDERKIETLSALKTQVEACNTNLDAGMFPEEVDAVANLLNEEYYKFGQ